MEGSEPQQVIFTTSKKQSRALSRVVVYHGNSLDGLEFAWDDGSTQLFGKKGGKQGGDTFDFGKFRLLKGQWFNSNEIRCAPW